MNKEYEILKDQIVYFPNAIPNYQEIVDHIESLDTKSITGWHTWYAGHEDKHVYGEIKYMKRSFYNEDDSDKAEKCKFVIESLCNYISECAVQYGEIFDLSKDYIKYAIDVLKNDKTTIGVNKYNEGEHMGPHVDLNDTNKYLQYTVVVYLNDDYEGGELYFPNHDIRLKPKSGSIAMYPSGDPYTHQSLKVIKGRKMLITHHLAKEVRQ
jgi:hypothetical protein